jgi:hypothetical protein
MVLYVLCVEVCRNWFYDFYVFFPGQQYSRAETTTCQTQDPTAKNLEENAVKK